MLISFLIPILIISLCLAMRFLFAIVIINNDELKCLITICSGYFISLLYSIMSSIVLANGSSIIYGFAKVS